MALETIVPTLQSTIFDDSHARHPRFHGGIWTHHIPKADLSTSNTEPACHASIGRNKLYKRIIFPCIYTSSIFRSKQAIGGLRTFLHAYMHF
jgi:hypothetical protein